jgi:RNA polymerase sigma-70 factor (ECF subfamily)
MHPPISEPDLVTLLDEADAAGARLRRRLRLPRADLDDLRQDLLLDLIRRLPAFDARRGSIGAFAGIILRNHASRIATQVARERRATSGGLLSLDAVGSDGQPLADRLGEADSLAAWHGQCIALETAIAANIDLSRALGALHPRDRSLCAAMARCPVRGLVGRGLGSRATLYRRLRELRCVLAAHGARAA